MTTVTTTSAETAKEAVRELFCTSLGNKNEHNLLRFNGQIRWWDGESSNRSHKAAYTLMDNGASDLFVSRRMADSLAASGAGKIVDTGKMVRVKVATERKPVRKKHETMLVNLWLGGHQYERWMTVLDMDEYDIILGKPWYTEMNGRHTIDYERNAVWIHPRKQINPESNEPLEAETAGNQPTKPAAPWTGMLLGLRPWEGKGCRAKTNHDIDSINAILSKVQVVWGGGAVDRDARKNKGAFLVRLHNVQDPQVVENAHAFTRGLEKDFASVFEAPKGIPIRWKDGKAVEMHIDLVDNAGTPFKTPYRLSRAETEELVKVLTIALEKGWIRPSSSSFGAPVLFVPKKAADGSLTKLRMVIDYRELNKLTKKDRYPLPLIDDLMDGLEGSRVFSKMDLASGYNQLGIVAEDRYKTAFVTKFGLFEWTVVPFGLANAPAFFMRWMDEILQANPHLRSFVKVYLDDILVHSGTVDEHDEHLREVLRILHTFGMKVERRKCEFFADGLDFLGFRVDGDGVHVDATKAAAVHEWGTPASPRAVKSFLGLVGYYRKFVPGFADIARPLYTASTATPRRFTWTSACEKAFAQLKYLVTHAPVLAIPTQDGDYVVRTDASQNAVGAVLMQKQLVDGKEVERTIAFYSRQLTPAQRNYGAYDRELLAIEEAVLHWRYYLQQARFIVYTDHHSIQHLLSQRLTHRQMSYFATLLGYDFTIKYWPGSKNDIADALSRRYDEVIHTVDASYCDSQPQAQAASSRELWLRRKQERRVAYALGITHLPRTPDTFEVYVEPASEPIRQDDLEITVMATQAVVANVSDVRDELISGYPDDKWLAPVWKILRAEKELQRQLNSGAFDNLNPLELKKFREATLQRVRQEISKTEWERSRRFTLSQEGVLMHKELVCVPAGPTRQNLLREVHDTMVGGHIGPAKMHLRLTQLGVYWRRMEADCRRYTKGCSTCLRVKPSNQKPTGLLQQLTVPQGRWERIGIDFITDLPPSGAAGYDAIMSIIDHMTKRAHFIPYHKATGAEATAHLFIERYFPLHGIPGAIVSDRDKRFVNDFWQAFTKEVGTDIRLSSSAHPETDGQTEKANDIVGVYLKCFATRYVTTDCKGWHRLLPLAEFAYNATPQKALGRSPFEVDLGYIPPSKIELIGAAIGARSLKESARSKQGKEFAEHMEALLLAAKDDLEAARDAQRADANTKRRDHDFQEGDMVLLDAPKDHMTYSNPVPGSSKLQHRYGGPHRIIWVRGAAVKLDMGTDLPIHPVFHVSRLRHDTTDRSRPQEPIPPLRLTKEGGGVCELKSILEHTNAGTNKKNLRYLVEWDDYTGDTAWLELDGLRNARELVEEYHEKHGLGPVDWDAKRRAQQAKAKKKRKEYWG
jgi:hypothetical protein